MAAASVQLHFQNSQKMEQTLYISDHPDLVQKFLLPPPPPPGNFDVRFRNQSLFSETDDIEIFIQNIHHPLRISLTKGEGEYQITEVVDNQEIAHHFLSKT
ncbi:MAG: hypothetical protein Kow0042_23260 [Calditrichia bacterium]